MANEKHLLLTITGKYDDPTLSEEIWQTGVRCILDLGGSVEPIGTLPNNWEPVAATIARDETDWTIDGNWTIDGVGALGFAADDWLNDQVAPAIGTWIADTKASNAVQVTDLNVYPIGAPSGRSVPAPPYTSGSPVHLQWKTPLGAGTVSGMLPLQNSVVASHRTSQIGRRGRGRMFLPPTGPSSVSYARLTDTARDAIAAGHAAFLEAISDIGGVSQTLRPIVTGAPWTQYAVVGTVVVDDVMDTQRRRRNKLTPDAASVTVSY